MSSYADTTVVMKLKNHLTGLSSANTVYKVKLDKFPDKAILTLDSTTLEVKFVTKGSGVKNIIINTDAVTLLGDQSGNEIAITHNFDYTQWANNPYFHVAPKNINDGRGTIRIEQIKGGKVEEN